MCQQYDTVDIRKPYFGLDEHGVHRYMSVADHSGMVTGGVPGRGKTGLVHSLLYQWSMSPVVQFALLDGLGSHNYDAWDKRISLRAGDDLDRALDVLTAVHELMGRRKHSIIEALGTSNFWNGTPTPLFPLFVLIIDECQTYLDSTYYKKGSEKFDKVQECTQRAAELVRKGRASGMFTWCLTQNPTGDSLPSVIQANCGLAASYGVRTMEAAVASLGPDIRAYESHIVLSVLLR